MRPAIVLLLLAGCASSPAPRPSIRYCEECGRQLHCTATDCPLWACPEPLPCPECPTIHQRLPCWDYERLPDGGAGELVPVPCRVAP